MLTVIFSCSLFQLYWVGDLVGAVLGALLYDRLFSTRVCLTWLSEGCSVNIDENNSKDKSIENETVYVIEADKNHTVTNDDETVHVQENGCTVNKTRL